MNAKSESIVNKSDLAKWVLTVLIFALALAANYYFSKIAAPIRVIGWFVIFAGLLAMMTWTTQGKQAVEFLGEARMELRKVVWPSSQETVQTTGLIILMVVLFGLIMWGFDSLLLFLIGMLTG